VIAPEPAGFIRNHHGPHGLSRESERQEAQDKDRYEQFRPGFHVPSGCTFSLVLWSASSSPDPSLDSAILIDWSEWLDLKFLRN
jgi:hypothetical protein